MSKKLLALVLTVALLGLPLPPVRADDSDIFGAEISPNVLLAFDTSGSMDDLIPANPYSASTTYTGTYDAAKVYKKTWSGYSVYKNTIAEVPDTADTPPSSARDALTKDGHWSGKIGGSKVTLSTGNYLNWMATAGTEQVKKIVVAKRVLTKLVTNTEGVRFGLMSFTANPWAGQGGGKILAEIGSDKATLTTKIDELAPSGFTPLGEMLRDAGKYYKGQGDYNGDHTTSPIQYDCQPSFVIIMSDGLENGTVKIGPEATNRYTQDHSSFTGKQNVLVDTIGFAVDPTDKDAANAVLQAAAKNGGGTFFSTESETQLEAALEDLIRQIVAATFAFATPTIPSTSTTGSTKAYLAAFKSDPSRPFWYGYLKAYNRDSTGNVPVDAITGIPLDSALAWEAGSKLAPPDGKAAADRKIYTQVGSSRVEFKTGTSEITAAMLGVADADRDKVIDFIRGVDTTDENGNGNVTEERVWKLGDIFHSTPVLVTPPIAPTPPSDDGSYAAFKTANATRTTIMLAGANDGMLHAFREDTGEELWAFIPPDLLPNLKLLTASSGEHTFFVDGSPIAADVKIAIPSDSTVKWRTIVLFGERRGGKSYHALDITDAANPLYLWSFTDAKLGETWSDPVIGKVKLGGVEKFVAFVGGGYDTAQNNRSGKAVFAIDLATGTKLWEYYNTGSASDDRQYMNFSLPAAPTAVDLNLDGVIDRVYIGDIGGQVWKFDVSADVVSNWTGKRLFAAPLATGTTNPPAAGEYYPAQAIYAPIIPALDEPKNVWIYFGTGDRNHPNNTTAPNRFYGIKDNVAMTGTTLTESDLVDITSTDATVTQGFYIRLGTNEKVLAAADVFNKVVFFTTFIPTSTTACGTGGGTAKLYAVQMITGYAALDWAHDGAQLTTTDATKTRGKEIGTGIPSKPIVVITESGVTLTTSVVAATTSQQLPSNSAPPPSFMRKVLYWREVF
jgi:type IV pilus assembly protein PilY1